MLEFGILGSIEAIGEDGPIRLGGPKQRATLAILLLNANRVVSIDRLADELYAGRAPVTAATQVHRQISELRKTLGPDSGVETRSPGYVIRVSLDQLDLRRFERMTEDAGLALARGEAEAAFELQRAALDLWRGPALADLAHEPFAQIAIERLDEIRLAAIELRIDAELALGRHKALVGELTELAAEHLLHEPFVSRLMLALYRSGRQADALEAYRQARETLVESFGIEPNRELRGVERAILNQDPSLDLGPGAFAVRRPNAEPDRVVLVLPSADERLEGLLTVAEPLATSPGGGLMIVRLLADDDALVATAAMLATRRISLDVETRTAAFTSTEPIEDAVRMASTYAIRLLLLDAPPLDLGTVPEGIVSVLERSPCDVGLLTRDEVDWSCGDGVYVPFSGGEHDWTALEIAARLAASGGLALRLVGAKGQPRDGRRDASRLLAAASIAVQRAVGVDASPLLVAAEREALAEAVERATIVVIGLSTRWREEGLGDVRGAVARGRQPTLLVHGGPRPSVLAPVGSDTRYTWTLDHGTSYLQGLSTAAT